MNPALAKFIEVNQGQDITAHLSVLYSYARTAPGNRVLELGVRHGLSTTALATGCWETNKTLYSVDTEDCVETGKRIAEMGLGGNWIFIKGDDRNGCVPDEMFGLVLVDTSHEKEHTRQEIEIYSPKVLVGGFMAFHDTYLNGKYWEGVSEPVYEFLERNPNWETVYTSTEDNGMAIIKRKE